MNVFVYLYQDDIHLIMIALYNSVKLGDWFASMLTIFMHEQIIIISVM